jgi:protein-S-isoprenylcysteine O-methyltransferase Ste14
LKPAEIPGIYAWRELQSSVGCFETLRNFARNNLPESSALTLHLLRNIKSLDKNRTTRHSIFDMKRMSLTFTRSLAFAAPALIAYLVLAPIACGRLDILFGIRDAMPRWSQLPGALLILAGAPVSLWTFVLFLIVGDGTPNPIAPPRKLVRNGPFRYSRNPMMLGGWIAGFGLGLLLRSPSYLALCGVAVLAGAVYVLAFEEPSLLRRFGRVYFDYCAATPRWFGCPHA